MSNMGPAGQMVGAALGSTPAPTGSEAARIIEEVLGEYQAKLDAEKQAAADANPFYAAQEQALRDYAKTLATHGELIEVDNSQAIEPEVPGIQIINARIEDLEVWEGLRGKPLPGQASVHVGLGFKIRRNGSRVLQRVSITVDTWDWTPTPGVVVEGA